MSEQPLTISAFREGDSVNTRLLVLQSEVRQSKTGSSYLHLIFRDATGTITAFMWDNFDSVAGEIQQGSVTQVKGRVQKYRNSLQLIVHKMETVPSGSVVAEEFMPAAESNVEEMFEELLRFVESMENQHLKTLLKEIFGDSAVADPFKAAPAAKTMHHSYIGGLLEHTLSLVKLCNQTCQVYEHLNRDLLITGACLHDIGKIRELSREGWVDYSREGRLLGHITLGVQLDIVRWYVLR